MGRKIYLLRHAKPKLDVPRCIGITDVPLSDEGRRQAEKIAGWLGTLGIRRIYSSPLVRCRDTAEIIADRMADKTAETRRKPEVRIREELHEVRAGEWEYLSFAEIKEKHFKTYEERGKNIGYYELPGGESFYQGSMRFARCMREILEESEDDILIVAHSGVISGFLCGLQQMSVNRIFELPQSYVGVAVLDEEDRGRLTVRRIGYHPPEYLDDEEMKHLYKRCNTPEPVIGHMRAVAEYIDGLKDIFPICTGESSVVEYTEPYGAEVWYGIPDNWDILRKAALLHDIMRTGRHHAEAGAKLLEKEGYPEIAALVRAHDSADGGDSGRDEGKGGPVTMEEVLFYADKRVREDRVVSLEERFQASYIKCRTPEAREKHRRLYQKAIDIENRIDKITGGRRL